MSVLVLTVVTASSAAANPSLPIVPRPPVEPAPAVVVQGGVVKLEAERSQWLALAAAASTPRPQPLLQRPSPCDVSVVPTVWQPAIRRACAAVGAPAVRRFLTWVASPKVRAEITALRPGRYRVVVEEPARFEPVPDMIPYVPAA